jgi:hypothetical protein
MDAGWTSQGVQNLSLSILKIYRAGGIMVEIEQVPFRRYILDQEGQDRPDIFTIRLNSEERAQLEECKPLIQQTKDSTAIKTLAEIGANFVLHDRSVRVFLETLFKNKRNNERIGIPIAPPNIDTNVIQKSGSL